MYPGCHTGPSPNLLQVQGAGEDGGRDESEMRQRFGTTACQTTGMIYKKEMILPGGSFGPVTPDTRNGATRDEVKAK